MNISAVVTGVVTMIIGIVVIFYIVGNSSTTLTDAATNISGSGLPLASLFSPTGVVLLIFMAGILLTVIMLAFGQLKGK